MSNDSVLQALLDRLPPVTEPRLKEKLSSAAVSEVAHLVVEPPVSANTAKCYNTFYGKFKKWCNQRRKINADEAEEATVYAYIFDLMDFDSSWEMATGAQPGTAVSHLAAIKWVRQRLGLPVGNFSRAERLIRSAKRNKSARNPVRAVPATRPHLRRLVDTWSPTISEQLVRACLLVSSDTGLDPADVCQLTPESLEWDGHRVLVHYKDQVFELTRQDRVWACPVRALEDLVQATPNGSPLLNVTPGHPQEWLDRYSKLISSARRRAGLDATTAHPASWPNREVLQVAGNMSRATVLWIRNTALILFAWTAGMRGDEIRRLEVEWLSSVDTTWFVRIPTAKGDPQGDHFDQVPVGHDPERLLCGICAMDDWLVVGDLTHGPVFPGHGGTPIVPASVQEIFNRRTEAASLPELTVHSLRRGRAQDLANQDRSDVKIGKHLRHRNLQSTVSYLDGRVGSNREVMSRMLGSSQQTSQSNPRT